MDPNYIERVRSKLQRRLKRLNTTNFRTFHAGWLRTWGFLQENEITRSILEDLERQFACMEQAAEETLHGDKTMAGSTESRNVAICYWILKKCAGQMHFEYLERLGNRLGRQKPGLGGLDPDECTEVFRKTYVEVLFDYIDEQIDDKQMILALLKKYKHRCEWFRRERMLAAWKGNTKQGEKTLVFDLYEYLHDQGLQFHIEPQSDSGRVDLISNQSGKDRLIADAKIFNPDSGQNASYIIKGFRQIYDYTRDFNEPFGYLVIFKTCEPDLSVPAQDQESSIPFITHNNKIIFIVVIDIFPYDASASKRGKLKAYEILPAQFIESLSEVVPPAEPPKTEPVL